MRAFFTALILTGCSFDSHGLGDEDTGNSSTYLADDYPDAGRRTAPMDPEPDPEPGSSSSTTGMDPIDESTGGGAVDGSSSTSTGAMDGSTSSTGTMGEEPATSPGYDRCGAADGPRCGPDDTCFAGPLACTWQCETSDDCGDQPPVTGTPTCVPIPGYGICMLACETSADCYPGQECQPKLGAMLCY
jgi:hypothetical protein